MCFSFSVNGFHELVHNTVFRTRWLNSFFCHAIAFLGWYSPTLFWASHSEHHRYTLYPPDDGEVVLPVEMTLKDYLRSAFFDLFGFYNKIRSTIRRGFFGKLDPGWHTRLFPPENVEDHCRLFAWDRILVVGHLAVAGSALYLGWWQVLPLVTVGSIIGRWLFLLCNSSQYVGLTDEVPDFRQNSRTIYLNPVVQFLYWHMNYHIEHHMFAAAPCYKLGRLHLAIHHELPHCPKGLIATWREIVGILKPQKVDPEYEFIRELPMASVELATTSKP